MLDMHCNHAASRIQSFFRRHSRPRPRLVFAGVDEDRDEKPQDLSVPPVMLSNCNSTFLVADTGRGSRAFLNSEPRLLPVRPAGPEYFIASQPLSTGISAIIDPVIPRLAASKPAGICQTVLTPRLPVMSAVHAGPAYELPALASGPAFTFGHLYERSV